MAVSYYTYCLIMCTFIPSGLVVGVTNAPGYVLPAGSFEAMVYALFFYFVSFCLPACRAYWCVRC